MTSKEIQNIFVSSENRDTALYPNGNSYTLHLTTPVKEITKVELLHASVPNTLYNISNGTNVIAFSNLFVSADSNVSNLTLFSIPLGFYSASGIASEIQAAVSNISGVSISYLMSEGKFLFSRPTSGNTFSVFIQTAELANVLGFSNLLSNSTNVATVSASSNVVPLYSDNTKYISKNFIKSEKVVNLNPNEGIFLDIQELRTNFNQAAVSLVGSKGTYSGATVSRTFGLIPMDVQSGTIKRFKKTSDYDFEVKYPYPIQRLDRLTISWTDKNGVPVNFNGLNDNSFILRLHTERKSMC